MMRDAVEPDTFASGALYNLKEEIKKILKRTVAYGAPGNEQYVTVEIEDWRAYDLARSVMELATAMTQQIIEREIEDFRAEIDSKLTQSTWE